MRQGKPSTPADAEQETLALIETLHETGQRLEEPTAGEVDSVANHAGRTVLLRGAQVQLRHSEAVKQAAILNAPPANFALLDTQGIIISVNEAWRRFVRIDAPHAPGYAIGVNYLAICGDAEGDGASEVNQAAAISSPVPHRPRTVPFAAVPTCAEASGS